MYFSKRRQENCFVNYWQQIFNKSGPRLHSAVLERNVEKVRKILESTSKENLNALNSEGRAALHYAVIHNSPEIVDLLWEYNADFNVRTLRQKCTPLLMLTCAFEKINNFELAKALVENYGSDVNAADFRGWTPLHYAAIQNYRKLIKIFLKCGADINARHSGGYTPLLSFMTLIGSAVIKDEEYSDYAKTLIFLLEHSDVNVKDDIEQNILYFYHHEKFRRIVFEHLAKMEILNLPLPSFESLHKYKYFTECTEELSRAKNTKLQNCWVTFFNLLTDSDEKLIKYAGNEDLIENFEKSDFLEKFPIYGERMKKNIKKAIKRRQIWNTAAIILSGCLPIFNPTHLIIQDILDCLPIKHLPKLCE